MQTSIFCADSKPRLELCSFMIVIGEGQGNRSRSLLLLVSIPESKLTKLQNLAIANSEYATLTTHPSPPEGSDGVWAHTCISRCGEERIYPVQP